MDRKLVIPPLLRLICQWHWHTESYTKLHSNDPCARHCKLQKYSVHLILNTTAKMRIFPNSFSKLSLSLSLSTICNICWLSSSLKCVILHRPCYCSWQDISKLKPKLPHVFPLYSSGNIPPVWPGKGTIYNDLQCILLSRVPYRRMI